MRARGEHRQAKHGQGAFRDVTNDPQKGIEPDPRKRLGASHAWVQLLPLTPDENAGWILAPQPDKGLVGGSIRSDSESGQPSRHSSPSSAQSPSSGKRGSTGPHGGSPGLHRDFGSSAAHGADASALALSKLLAPVKAYVEGNVEQGDNEVVCLHW